MNFKEEYTDRVEKIEKILKKYLPELNAQSLSCCATQS